MNTIEELYGKIIKSKCFLCNKEFDGADNEEVCLLFDKRLDENGIESCSFAEVLSSILGRFIHESIAHSNLICQSCVDMIENYEIVEQNLIGIKHNIIENFNKSSKENNIPEIYVDDIILNEDNVVDGVVDVNASANEDKRIENESFSIINVINENNSPECILYDNYDQQQQQEDNNVEENDLIDEKRIKMIKQDNNNAQIGEVNEENNIIVKQEIENENESEEEEEEEEELFVQNDDENMIEIITGDDVNNEEMIDQLNDESEYCDENNTSNEMDSNVDDENINLENDNSKTKEKHSQSSSVSSIRSKRKYGQLNPPTEPVYSINDKTASSSSIKRPRKYRQFSREQKNLLIKNIEEGKSIAEAARNLNMNINTAKSIHKRYKDNEEVLVFKKRGGSNARKLTDDVLREIDSFVERNPGITICGIQQHLKNKNIFVSIGTIDNGLRALMITLKLPSSELANVNDEETLRLRKEYAIMFSRQAPEDRNKLIFIGECGFNLRLKRSQARSKQSTKAGMVIPTVRGRNAMLIMAMNSEGIVHYNILANSMCSSSKFCKFLQELKEKVEHLQNPWFVMDNAAIHRTTEVREIVHDFGIELKYLPPCSPMLNPIEKAFSKIKCEVRKILSDIREEHDLTLVVLNSLAKVTSTDAVNYVTDMMKLQPTSAEDE